MSVFCPEHTKPRLNRCDVCFAIGCGLFSVGGITAFALFIGAVAEVLS